jgi:hypothetical protein
MLLKGKTQNDIDNEAAAKARQNEIQKLQTYLDDTDWYVVRFSETGKIIPEEIRTERENARVRISELKTM